MDGVPALRFATAARRLGAAARASGLLVPAFRSPPRVREASRTLRRYPGGAVVSVTLRGRSYVEVVDDMIDGVLAANRVGAESRPRLRQAFQLALSDELAAPDIDLPAIEQAERRPERARSAEAGATQNAERRPERARSAEAGATHKAEQAGPEPAPPTLTSVARVAERQTQAA